MGRALNSQTFGSISKNTMCELILVSSVHTATVWLKKIILTLIFIQVHREGRKNLVDRLHLELETMRITIYGRLQKSPFELQLGQNLC